MMTTNQFAALLGFAFAFVWIAFELGDALLCLVGAAVFYVAASFYRGDLDLADVQARFGPRQPSEAPMRARTGPPRVR